MATSMSLILSYVVDWIIIILFFVVGAVFVTITPNHRAFNLADPDISFPYLAHETISIATLVGVGLVAPAVIIFLICNILVPGPTVTREIHPGLVWRRKLWEWNTGWMGLGLSLGLAFFLTQGLKLLFGRPRPDLISRCRPDVDALNDPDIRVGGLGALQAEGTGAIMVDYHICKQPDSGVLADGFMSFPSGHASFSWAGLLYLSLFVCAKFAITVPYLLPGVYDSQAFSNGADNGHASMVNSSSEVSNKEGESGPGQGKSPLSMHAVLRSQAAAPPVWLIVLALIPICTASYITATRFTDYRHHAFDLIIGLLLGVLTAYTSFRWFHAPIRRGAGWSWGPRSPKRAWIVGLGVQGYSGQEPRSLLHGAEESGGTRGALRRHDDHRVADVERAEASGART